MRLRNLPLNNQAPDRLRGNLYRLDTIRGEPFGSAGFGAAIVNQTFMGELKEKQNALKEKEKNSGGECDVALKGAGEEGEVGWQGVKG